ncbi:hypothetical protein KDL44_11300 [bacterium]|nr:hypothetical protein [bacterium]
MKNFIINRQLTVDCTTIILFITLALTSCGGSDPSTANPVVERYAYFEAWEIDSAQLGDGVAVSTTSLAPLQIGVVIGYSYAPPKPSGNQEWISKFEVDFGDGAGWQDVTSEARNWDYGGNGDRDPNRLTRHTYSLPGSYTVKGRLTYWDGDIHLTSRWNPEMAAFGDKTIIILPPE